MMGLQVGSKYLYVKKVEEKAREELVGGEEEVFRLVIEDRPSRCLVMRNVVSLQDNHQMEDFKELEFDVEEEMKRYGQVVRTHVPRPPKYGDPYACKGFGKVYVKFMTELEAEKAKKALFKRRLNDRFIEVQYYSDDKFVKNVFE